jgi:hypothetical protein
MHTHRHTYMQSRVVFSGLDVSRISLHRLRNAISVVSQDPIIFSGTVCVCNVYVCMSVFVYVCVYIYIYIYIYIFNHSSGKHAIEVGSARAATCIPSHGWCLCVCVCVCVCVCIYIYIYIYIYMEARVYVYHASQ